MPLLVTDDAIAQVLRSAGMDLELVTGGGRDVLAHAEARRPELAILDATLAHIPGVEVCKRLKQDARRDGEWLPIVIVGNAREVAARVEALRSGADDYLTRPCDPLEVTARVEALLRTRRTFDEIRRGSAEVEEFAIHDRLTGLYNQRYLTQRLGEEFRRASRYNEALSIIAIDLDELERVNGRWGRGAGDRLLEECAKTLSAACREVDIVARAGGDEFIALLPNAHVTIALAAAERAWNRLRAVQLPDPKHSVGVSLGVACYPNRDVTSATDLLRLAHDALAQAKTEGKGRICLYQHQGYVYRVDG